MNGPITKMDDNKQPSLGQPPLSPIAANLRRLRLDRGMSLAQVARLRQSPFVVGSVRLNPGKVGSGRVVTVKTTITTTQPTAGKVVGSVGTQITFDAHGSAMFFPESDVVFISAENESTVDQNVKNLQRDYDHRLFTVRVTIDTPQNPTRSFVDCRNRNRCYPKI